MQRYWSCLVVGLSLFSGCASQPKVAESAAQTAAAAAPASAVVATVSASADTPPTPTPPQVHPDRRVLVVSIDGLRPDLMLLADCPTLRSLMDAGSYSMWARTTEMGVTLPSHTSMVTGRKIVYHGIHWNGDTRPDTVEYDRPQVPTLFDLAHAADFSTAVVSGKAKFRFLTPRSSLDVSEIPDKTRGDAETADAAIEVIRDAAPQVMLLHFAQVDGAGHHDGWGTPPQLDAIENADRQLGRVLDQLDAQGLRDHTLIIVSADHGGFGKTHSGYDPRGRHIPWIITGPGVRPNYDLTQLRDLEIETFDTFATVCDYLGIAIPDRSDGVPVRDAFVNPDETRAPESP